MRFRLSSRSRLGAPGVPGLQVKLIAPIKPHLSEDEPRTITGEGSTYDQARDALLAQVPEGWDVLYVITD